MNYPASEEGRRVLWAILFAALAVSTAQAQEAKAAVAEVPNLTPGQHLRVTAASPTFNGRTVGSLVRVGPDRLTLVDAERGAVTELDLNSVTRIEIGVQRRQTRKGALIGLAVGAVLTLAIFASDEPTCGPYMNSPCTTEDNLMLSAFSVGLSVGIGAWWGHSKKSEQWTEAPIPRVKVGIRPERGGGRVGIAVSF